MYLRYCELFLSVEKIFSSCYGFDLKDTTSGKNVVCIAVSFRHVKGQRYGLFSVSVKVVAFLKGHIAQSWQEV